MKKNGYDFYLIAFANRWNNKSTDKRSKHKGRRKKVNYWNKNETKSTQGDENDRENMEYHTTNNVVRSMENVYFLQMI